MFESGREERFLFYQKDHNFAGDRMNARALVAGVVGALILLAGGVSVLSGQGSTSPPSAGALAFSKDVQPFLAKNCYPVP